jgi:aminoacyl tRNA synthase complex-interacting multifunctional protein 1
VADVSLYCHLHPQLVSSPRPFSELEADAQVSAPAAQHPSQPSVLRYFLQIQSLSSVQSAQSKNPNSYPPLDIDVSTLTTPERKVVVPPKKEKKDKKATTAEPAAAATAGGIVGAVTGVVAAAGSAVGSAAEAVKNAVVGEVEAAPAPKKEKKEKKEKKDKPKVEAKVETGPMPSMIDMRVGKVLDGMSACTSSTEMS